MALLIKTDGTKQELKGEEADGSLSYQQLNKACGGYIQMVPCDPKVTGGYDHFYCNEEGKLTGLEGNLLATEMSTYTAPYDVICGDVVFCKENGEGGSL